MNIVESDTNDFGSYIASVLADNDKSESWLAKQVGKSPQAVAKWLKGKGILDENRVRVMSILQKLQEAKGAERRGRRDRRETRGLKMIETSVLKVLVERLSHDQLGKVLHYIAAELQPEQHEKLVRYALDLLSGKPGNGGSDQS